MGWAGFLLIVPWIQAFIWAFKPTDVVAGERRGTVAAERNSPQVRPAAASQSAGPLCREDHAGGSGPVEVPDRRARRRRNLHGWRRLCCSAPDRHAHVFVAELALPHILSEAQAVGG